MEPAFFNDQQGVTQCPNEFMVSVASSSRLLYNVKFYLKISLSLSLSDDVVGSALRRGHLVIDKSLPQLSPSLRKS